MEGALRPLSRVLLASIIEISQRKETYYNGRSHARSVGRRTVNRVRERGFHEWTRRAAHENESVTPSCTLDPDMNTSQIRYNRGGRATRLASVCK